MIQNFVMTFDNEEIENGGFEEYLNKCGEEGFRLHTCELLGNGRVLTVVERYIEVSEAEPDMDETPEGALAMAVKG